MEEDANEEASLEEVKRKARVSRAMFQRHSKLVHSAVLTIQRIWRGYIQREFLEKVHNFRVKILEMAHKNQIE